MEPDAALASLSRRSLQNLAKEFGIKANLKSEVIKAELLSKGWKDHNENDCSANFSDSGGLSSAREDSAEAVAPRDPSSTNSDQTGISHSDGMRNNTFVPVEQEDLAEQEIGVEEDSLGEQEDRDEPEDQDELEDQGEPGAPHAPLPQTHAGGTSTGSSSLGNRLHTEQRALMRAQRRASLAQALATAPPVRRPLELGTQQTITESTIPGSPTQAMADKHGLPAEFPHAQQDPLRKQRQISSAAGPAVPPRDVGAATAGHEKMRDRYGAPFAFHRMPAERLPGPRIQSAQPTSCASPSRRMRAPVAPSPAADWNGTWPAAPSPARPRSARAPTARQPVFSPFVEHRPAADIAMASTIGLPCSNAAAGHANVSNQMPNRTSDAHDGAVPRSPLTNRSAQLCGSLGMASAASHSGRLRMSQSDMSTRTTPPTPFPTQPSLPSVGSMGTAPSHSGRLTSRFPEAPARTTPPSPYNGKGKPRPALSRPGMPLPTRGARTDSQNPADNEDSELASCRAAVESEILMTTPSVHWSDIAGMTGVKRVLQEAVVLPSMRPDIFTGLRAPTRGVLLFGPPGTGKSLLAKAVATEANSTFFCMSASSLTSRYVGRGEKMVRALFEAAERMQPAIIFIDEIDSVLSARSASEHEASRRLKTEFLLRFDGLKDGADSRVIVIGATNRPRDLDDAVLRRLARRVHVPLPNLSTRLQLLHITLENQASQLSGDDLQDVADATEGYSGSDMASLCKEAAMRPIRELSCAQLQTVDLQQLRHMNREDLLGAMKIVKPSVPQSVLKEFHDWNDEFGSDMKSL